MKYITVLIMLFSKAALAGTVDVTTSIKSIGVVTNDYTIIEINNNIDGLPDCASSQPSLVSFDHTTQQGAAMLSIALSALHTNKMLKFVVNDSSCGVWGTRSLLARLYIYTS